MKIAVYSICGPGETPEHVRRMVRSADDADLVLVAMTCNNSDAANAAHDGAAVRRIDVMPFRFDDARNAALAMVPPDYDACIALDIDETLEPGWRDALKATIPVTLMPPTFVGSPWSASISFDFNGQVFQQNNRVHSRHGWRWKHPCHEALMPSLTGENFRIDCPGLLITHHPDTSKPRPNYLNLLAWGQYEDPTSLRMLHYYGRELMFHGYHKDALERFETYLKLWAKHDGPVWEEVTKTVEYRSACLGHVQS